MSQSLIEPPRLPARLAVSGFVIALVAVVALIPDWDPSSGEMLVLVVSGPLFLASCLIPFLYRPGGRNGIGVVFTTACAVYLLSFGVRAYYLIAFPSVHLFPNFDPARDLINVHRGLLWGSLGMTSMVLAYVWSVRRTSRSNAQRVSGAPKVRSRDELFRLMSSGQFVAALYLLGLFGRLYMLQSGAATYIYNSPAFDIFAVRGDLVLGGIAGLLADFCPLALGIMVARQWGRGWRNWAFLIVVLMLVVEAAFFSFGLYKYGLIGVLLIPVMALAARSGRSFSMRGIAIGAIFALGILPVGNAARTQLLPFYTRTTPLTADVFNQLGQSVQGAYDMSGNFAGPRFFLDPLFERLDGVEALAVSDKYLPQEGHVWGATYGNLLALGVPRALRLWSSQPTYIPWETNYVGFGATNFTVVPMPAIVEAYLNFDIPGVIVVMFLLGLLYARIDSLGISGRAPPFAAGLLAYAGWKMLDIETNLFIVLLPLVKVVLVVMAMGLLYRLFRRSPAKRPAMVPSSSTAVP